MMISFKLPVSPIKILQTLFLNFFILESERKGDREEGWGEDMCNSVHNKN